MQFLDVVLCWGTSFKIYRFLWKFFSAFLFFWGGVFIQYMFMFVWMCLHLFCLPKIAFVQNFALICLVRKGWETVRMLSWLHAGLFNWKSMVRKTDRWIQWQSISEIPLYWSAFHTLWFPILARKHRKKNKNKNKTLFACWKIRRLILSFSLAFFPPISQRFWATRASFNHPVKIKVDSWSAILPVSENRYPSQMTEKRNSGS